MHVASLSRQILRLVDGVIRALLGSRPRPTLPPRTAAPAPARAVQAAPVPVVAAQPGPARKPAAPERAAKPRASAAKKSAKKTTKAAPKKPATAPVKTAKSLPRLSADASFADTVWIPRILWALAWSDAQKLGPQSAADLARILAGEAKLKVAPNNVARAFRDFAADKRTKGLWKTTGKTYEITDAGKKTLAKIK